MSPARTPVYCHVSDTVRGLGTIRSMRKKDKVLAEFGDHQDRHTAAWFLYLSSYHWLAIRSLFFLSLYTIILVFVSVAFESCE